MHLLNDFEIYTPEIMIKELNVYLNSLHFELLIAYITTFNKNYSFEYIREKFIELLLEQTRDTEELFIDNIYTKLKIENFKEKHILNIIDLLRDIINKIIFMKRRNKEQEETEKESKLLMEKWNYEDIFSIPKTTINDSNIVTVEFSNDKLNYKKLYEEAQKEFELNYDIP